MYVMMSALPLSSAMSNCACNHEQSRACSSVSILALTVGLMSGSGFRTGAPTHRAERRKRQPGAR